MLQRKATDVAGVARETVRKLGSRTSGHRLVIEMPPRLPRVEADQLRIERVLYNLIGNAIKYSPDGGEIRVFARREGRQLVVGVADQGMGISKEDQRRLFGRFQRLEAVQASMVPGAGLGLHVCRLLVEAHGGRIWVESEPDKGSTFYFTLPVSGETPESR